MRTSQFAFIALIAGAIAGPVFGASFEKRVAAPSDGVVEISNVAGLIDVSGWDRAEVEVTGELEEGNERVDVSSEGGRTRVRVVVRSHSQHSAEADLRIRVPHASEVQITAVSSDIHTQGITGAQRLNTVSGDIRAELGADATIKTVSGDLWVRGSSKPANLWISTVSGDLRLERAAGSVEATSVSGLLSLDVDPARQVRARTTSGDLSFRGSLEEGATFEVQSISGTLSLRARAPKGYEYEIESFSGEIDSCFNRSNVSDRRYGPGRRLSGVLGDGAGRLRVKSMSGDIEICDR